MAKDEENRRKNLLLLISAVKKQKQIAAAIGKDASYLSRMKSGSVSVTRGMAAQIEGALGLPNQWMEGQHEGPPRLDMAKKTSGVKQPSVPDYQEQVLIEHYRALPENLRSALRLIAANLQPTGKGHGS